LSVQNKTLINSIIADFINQNFMTTDHQTIKLDQFLKWVGAVSTGGEAKIMIQAGRVKVNNETETRRGRKLVTGDQVLLQGKSYSVDLN
jgi:ribosome-associated protein